MNNNKKYLSFIV